MKYKCTYTSGGGTEYDEGEWIIKRTAKTTTATKIKDIGIYGNFKVGEKIRIGFQTGNPIKDYNEKDDSFVVYFRQSGTPYYFELM